MRLDKSDRRTIGPRHLGPLALLLLLAPAAHAQTPAAHAQTPAAHAQTPTVVVELEGGPAWQSYNDVEIPNDGSATRFSLDELAGHGPWAAGRLYVTWNVAERHGLRVLAAPFSLTGPGHRPATWISPESATSPEHPWMPPTPSTRIG